MATPLDAASGRWPELLQVLAGLTDAQLTDRHQPCPACGGTDRYRWDRDDGPGGWFCNQCGGNDHRGGAGSGVDLLMRVRGWSLTDACRAVAQHLGLEQPIPDPPVAGARWWRYTPTVAVRRLPPKDIRPLTWDGSSWRLKAPPSPRPLYWPRRRAGLPILVVEGEPAADAAAVLFPDHAVCTWMSGCKAVRLADWQPLARQEVILWPDADAVGIEAMQRLAGILHGLGAAVSVVEPPAGVPKGWDLADAQWSPEQAARELADRATPWEPPTCKAGLPVDEPPGPSGPPAEPPQLSYRDLLEATLDAVRQDDEDAEMALRAEIMARFRRNDGQITAALFRLLAAQSQDGSTERPTYRSIDLRQVEGLDWLLEGFLPDRDQALLYAPAGAGKTTAALGMAFAVIDGTGFLDHDTQAIGGNVLLIASDSGPAPVVRALADMGRGDDPALGPSTTGHRLHCWAHDPSQGAMAWEASLRGCLALLRFVQEERIALVVIDSCKAVTAKCDLNYCDNGQVTALLTWAQEVLCRHTSVLWINHEGTGEGTAAGAKAWKEVPSIVHSIELVPAGPEDDSKPKRGGRQGRTSTVLRAWKVRKCRQGTAREFLYQVDTLTGRLGVATGVELKRDCRAHIVDVLAAALDRGVRSLHRKALAEELGGRFGYSRGTVSNGLTRVTGGRDPEVVRVGSLPGHYRLSDHWLEVTGRAGTGVSG